MSIDTFASIPRPVRVRLLDDGEGHHLGLCSNYVVYPVGMHAFSVFGNFQVRYQGELNDPLGIIQSAIDHARVPGAGITEIHTRSHEVLVLFSPAVDEPERRQTLQSIAASSGHPVVADDEDALTDD